MLVLPILEADVNVATPSMPWILEHETKESITDVLVKPTTVTISIRCA